MHEILQLTPDLNIGGMQNFVKQHAKYLSENEHPNSILCWFERREQDAECSYLNAKSVRDGRSYFRFRKIIKQKIDTSRPIIVHSHGITLLLSLFVLDLVLAKKLLWVHTIHNMVQNEAGNIRRIIWYILFKYFRITPVVISTLVESSFFNYYGGVKFERIDNKIDTTPFENLSSKDNNAILNEISLSKNRRRIVVVGRFDQQKNIFSLLQLINHSEIMWDFQYIFCIAHSEMLLPRSAVQLINQISKKTEIEVVLNRRDLRRIMAVSDFYLSFSLFEGLPLTLMEAMCAGCLPIVTPTGGADDAVGNLGIVAESFDEHDFLRAFKKGISTDLERHKIAKLSQEKFKYDTCGDAYVQLYQTKIERK